MVYHCRSGISFIAAVGVVYMYIIPSQPSFPLSISTQQGQHYIIIGPVISNTLSGCLRVSFPGLALYVRTGTLGGLRPGRLHHFRLNFFLPSNLTSLEYFISLPNKEEFIRLFLPIRLVSAFLRSYM